MSQTKRIRILTAVKRKYPHLSQKQIKKLLREKRVLFNGRPARRHGWVASPDKVIIPKKYLKRKLSPDAGVACRLIKKTKHYILFEKRPFVHSVAHDFSEMGTAANWLLAVDASLGSVGHPLESGLVHRLDYEASGVMVAARTERAWIDLKKKFGQQKVYKEYVCLVSNPPPKAAVYEAFVGKHLGNSQRIRIQSRPDTAGKLRRVQTKILSHKNKGNGRYELRILLLSGYRHQVRAHLSLLGSPIVGDKIYGGLPAGRLMLHASVLAFEGLDGKRIKGMSREPF